MGLSSSQARLLLLTARKSDLEYRGQQINNRRLSLSYQMEKLSKEYSDGISNRRLFVSFGEDHQQERVSYNTLQALGYGVKDKNGNPVGQNIDTDLLEIGLRNGSFHIEVNGQTKDWRTETVFRDSLNQEDDEMVVAEYEYKSAEIQSKDKQFEMELKQIDTQHKAVGTEEDAVKKVIQENVKKTFKTFG